MARDVFISHSTKDKAVADIICSNLEKNGVRCWIAPRDVMPGKSYAAQIVHGINDSKCLVVLLTANSFKSRPVRKELERAVSNEMHIISCCLDDVELDDEWSYYISAEQWLDGVDKQIEELSEILLESIRSLIPVPEKKSSISTPPTPPLVRSKVMWHVALNGQTSQGMSTGELISKIKSGEVKKDTMVWSADFTEWTSAGNVTELQEHFSKKIVPPPLQKVSKGSSDEDIRLGEKVYADCGNGVKLQLNLVEPGSFDMGSNDSDADESEKPVHKATLTNPFWIGKYEVTQKQYEAVMGTNPSVFKFKGSNYPVETVSWNDAMEFCEKLTDKEYAAGRLPFDYKYTLPTEAQWEFAARGGNKSLGYKYSGSDELDRVGWYCDNSGSKTHTVGQKAANELGLYDMSGNVWEWCSDLYGGYPSNSVVDPVGVSNGSTRVKRGSSWRYSVWLCRPTNRSWLAPAVMFYDLGFRLCLQTD